MRPRPLLILSTLLALLGSAETARAQLGPARSGSFAQADNVATAASNPSGLTRIDREQLVVGAMVGYSDTEFRVKPGTTTPGGDPDNDPSLFGLPTLSWARPVGEDWRVGFSVNVPTGIGSDYGSSWSGRYHASSSSLVFVNFTPAAAWKVNDWLSLGAGISLIYSSSSSKVAVNNPEPGLGDGRMELDVSGFGIGGNVGAMIELSPRTRFGLAYGLPSRTNMEGSPRFKGLGPTISALAPLLSQDIDLEMRVPQTLAGGVYHELTPRLALTADLIWIDFSRFGKVDIEVGPFSTTVDNRYQDIWAGVVGAQYRLTSVWTGSLSVAYLSSGVSDSNRSLGLPWDEFLVLGAGVRRDFGPDLRLHANLMLSLGGKGEIDQQSPLAGRLVGEFATRRTLLLELALVWGR
jgi:long-chain fatty acid transport protein